MGLGTGDTFSETSSAINWRPWATDNNNGNMMVTRPLPAWCRYDDGMKSTCESVGVSKVCDMRAAVTVLTGGC